MQLLRHLATTALSARPASAVSLSSIRPIYALRFRAFTHVAFACGRYRQNPCSSKDIMMRAGLFAYLEVLLFTILQTKSYKGTITLLLIDHLQSSQPAVTRTTASWQSPT
jgi:hypothetical protein